MVPLGEPVKCRAGKEILRDLSLERYAVETVSGHGFHPSKAWHALSTH
jgi:hypothetical protein